MVRSRNYNQKYYKVQDMHKKEEYSFYKNKQCLVWIITGVSALLVILSFTFVSSDTSKNVHRVKRTNIDRVEHTAKLLRNRDLDILTNAVNVEELWSTLTPMLIPRRPGTTNIQTVRNHIHKTLADLKTWHIDYDTFFDNTPQGRVEFSNILASTNPTASRKLVLACHYDSKDMRSEGYEFIGATDSAVPCAIMLEIARVLDVLLKEHTSRQLADNAHAPDVSLDFIFFDGEEAYETWTATDSIYGARHLANKLSNVNGRNALQDIDLFVLLDLIGHRETAFVNFHAHPSRWFDYAKSIEARLKKQGLLSHKRDVFYHNSRYEYHNVEDDHIPFQQRGVPILHLISTPFPRVWHTEGDKESALDKPRIGVVTKILTVFVAEYLRMGVPPK